MLSMMIPWLVTQPTIQSAQQLLGMQLSLAGCSGLIVETEAYLGVEDKAAHAFGGRKHRVITVCIYRRATFMFIKCASTAY